MEFVSATIALMKQQIVKLHVNQVNGDVLIKDNVFLKAKNVMEIMIVKINQMKLVVFVKFNVVNINLPVQVGNNVFQDLIFVMEARLKDLVGDLIAMMAQMKIQRCVAENMLVIGLIQLIVKTINLIKKK
jgi:hypothetical protein